MAYRPLSERVAERMKPPEASPAEPAKPPAPAKPTQRVRFKAGLLRDLRKMKRPGG